MRLRGFKSRTIWWRQLSPKININSLYANCANCTSVMHDNDQNILYFSIWYFTSNPTVLTNGRIVKDCVHCNISDTFWQLTNLPHSLLKKPDCNLEQWTSWTALPCVCVCVCEWVRHKLYIYIYIYMASSCFWTVSFNYFVIYSSRRPPIPTSCIA